MSETLDLLGKVPPIYASWPAPADDHRPGALDERRRVSGEVEKKGAGLLDVTIDSEGLKA